TMSQRLARPREPELAAPPAAGFSPAALLVELRPKQWLKNGALLLPLLYSLRLTEPEALARAALAFVSFCALSSAGYVFNDLRDRDADRLHPVKQHRPLAAGS